MSPLSLRRYRAERLLREEFEALRTKVLATVRRRLGARAISVDQADLEDCYAQAWQGLYAAVLEGQEIANPTGWLVLVTFRRAIEDLRSAHPDRRANLEPEDQALEPDLPSQLDDLRRLRQVFEALRKRLNPRECQAASLCYLQGLSRAQAAEHMGISESRMRKLMEGDGDGQSGVAGKVGRLLQVIREESWCEEQASLMRGFAFGILDPEGERYQLALLHQRDCPSCRSYVASLRGLAAILPPLALPNGLGAGLIGAGAGISGGALAGAGSGIGGASGGWLLAGGSLSVKFAGVLAALGLAGGLVLATSTKHSSAQQPSSAGLIGGGSLRSGLTTAASISIAPKVGLPIQHRPSPNAYVHSHGARSSRHRHTNIDGILASEVEFSPEVPHSSSELAQSSPPPPARPPSTPTVHPTHSSGSGAGGSDGEFGFEGSQSK